MYRHAAFNRGGTDGAVKARLTVEGTEKCRAR
jgi:hypothetical protein